MNTDPAIRGSLFAADFLNDPESIGELSAWKDLDDSLLGQFESTRQDPNESETEDDLRSVGPGSAPAANRERRVR